MSRQKEIDRLVVQFEKDPSVMSQQELGTLLEENSSWIRTVWAIAIVATLVTLISGLAIAGNVVFGHSFGPLTGICSGAVFVLVATGVADNSYAKYGRRIRKAIENPTSSEEEE